MSSVTDQSPRAEPPAGGVPPPWPDPDGEPDPHGEPGQASPAEEEEPPTEEHLLRRLLGERAMALGATATARLWGWLGPLAVTLLAGVLRFTNLSRPNALVFDEFHYVPQAWTLLEFGYEAAWQDDVDVKEVFPTGEITGYTTDPAYVIHPPVGKWMIALGIRLFGTTPFGWRFAAALVGTLTVLILARSARRLFSSTALGTLAGLLLAIDGVHLVLSRSALLDVFLTFFVVAAFACLLADRDASRRRLAARAAAAFAATGTLSAWGPSARWRWLRLAAGVLLGLACATKWSGVYFLAAFGLLTVAWDLTARHRLGVRRWAAAGVLRDGVPAFLAMVPVAALTYLAGWWSWFATSGGYHRQWAVQNPDDGVQWLPPALRSWVDFHRMMFESANNITSEHSYQSSPFTWLLQIRPTVFYSDRIEPGQDACGADSCIAVITSLGNPVLWWSATLAIGVAVYLLASARDWRAGAALVGIAAGWLPWLPYTERTVFTFYTVVIAPWMVLTLVYGLHAVLDGTADDPRRRRVARWAVAALVVLMVVVSAFFYPVWTAVPMSDESFHGRIWNPSWR